MKYILIIILSFFAIGSQGQTTAQQLSSLRAQDVIINKSIAELNAAIVKLLAIVAEQDAKIASMNVPAPAIQNNGWFTDSIAPVKKMIPNFLVLYVDTMSGLKFKKDTLYFKK